jgi:Domain of unknown function (DUF4865)
MLAMQYQITLPADYDMGIIRARVARAGSGLDGYQGLGLKAYLIRESGVDASPVNQYAPFYLWADSAGAASFLWAGDGFHRIVSDFGRPVVQTWVGGGSLPGAATAAEPLFAERVVAPIEADADPAFAGERLQARIATIAADPVVHSVAYGIDPRTWQSVVFTLFVTHPEAWTGELYQVLHLSAPEQPALPQRVTRRL